LRQLWVCEVSYPSDIPVGSDHHGRGRSDLAANSSTGSALVVTVDDTVECISVEGRARVGDQARDGDAIDHAVASYLTKYWDDPAVHPEMETFVRNNAIVEVTPELAFGIIEREDEFAPRATRWRW